MTETSGKNKKDIVVLIKKVKESSDESVEQDNSSKSGVTYDQTGTQLPTKSSGQFGNSFAGKLLESVALTNMLLKDSFNSTFRMNEGIQELIDLAGVSNGLNSEVSTKLDDLLEQQEKSEDSKKLPVAKDPTPVLEDSKNVLVRIRDGILSTLSFNKDRAAKEDRQALKDRSKNRGPVAMVGGMVDKVKDSSLLKNLLGLAGLAGLAYYFRDEITEFFTKLLGEETMESIRLGIENFKANFWEAFMPSLESLLKFALVFSIILRPIATATALFKVAAGTVGLLIKGLSGLIRSLGPIGGLLKSIPGAGIVGGLAKALGRVFAFIGFGWSAFGGIATALDKDKVAEKLGKMSDDVNILDRIVVGFAALGDGIWDWFFKPILDLFGVGFDLGDLGGKIVDGIEWVSNKFDSLPKELKNLVGVVTNVVKDIPGLIKTWILDPVFDFFKNHTGIGNVINLISNISTTIYDSIIRPVVDRIKSLPGAIRARMSELVDTVLGLPSDIAAWVKDTVTSALSGNVLISGIKNAIEDIPKMLQEKIFDPIKDIFNGSVITTFARNTANTLSDISKAFGNWLVSNALNMLPASVMGYEIRKNVADTLGYVPDGKGGYKKALTPAELAVIERQDAIEVKHYNEQPEVEFPEIGGNWIDPTANASSNDIKEDDYEIEPEPLVITVTKGADSEDITPEENNEPERIPFVPTEVNNPFERDSYEPFIIEVTKEIPGVSRASINYKDFVIDKNNSNDGIIPGAEVITQSGSQSNNIEIPERYQQSTASIGSSMLTPVVNTQQNQSTSGTNVNSRSYNQSVIDFSKQEGESVVINGGSGIVEPSSVVAGLLELIGKHESRGDYNALVYGKGGRNTPRRAALTDMTIDEVYKYQSGMISRGHASTAVGKYQIINSTLRGAVQDLGLDPKRTKFSPEVQDQLAIQLMRGRGLDRFLASDRNPRELNRFIFNLSKEWASLPKDSTGAGYYDGFNGNRAASNSWGQLAGILKNGSHSNDILPSPSTDSSEMVVRSSGSTSSNTSSNSHSYTQPNTPAAATVNNNTYSATATAEGMAPSPVTPVISIRNVEPSFKEAIQKLADGAFGSVHNPLSRV